MSTITDNFMRGRNATSLLKNLALMRISQRIIYTRCRIHVSVRSLLPQGSGYQERCGLFAQDAKIDPRRLAPILN
jgi:hypothetical protein